MKIRPFIAFIGFLAPFTTRRGPPLITKIAKGSSSNHPFSGAFAVSFREVLILKKIAEWLNLDNESWKPGQIIATSHDLTPNGVF